MNGGLTGPLVAWVDPPEIQPTLPSSLLRLPFGCLRLGIGLYAHDFRFIGA